MAIPLVRSVCQRLFTKAFTGGSRTYSTGQVISSKDSWPYTIVCGLVYSGWLSFVSKKARADARSAGEQKTLLDSKANGEGGQA